MLSDKIDVQNEMKWYAVSARNRRQYNRLAMLLQKLTDKEGDKIVEIYIPKETTTVQKKGNIFVTKEVSPLNCIFVYTNIQYLLSDELKKIIDIKFSIIEIRQDEINKLKNHFAKIENKQGKDMFEVGMMVRIEGDHHCASFEGQILAISSDKKIAKLRIWLIKGCEPFELDIKVENIRLIDGGND